MGLKTTHSSHPWVSWEYEENGRVLRAQWDGRDDGCNIDVNASAWDDGTPLDDDARQRFYDAIWDRRDGEWTLYDRGIPVRWNRGADGFLLEFQCGNGLDYLELGRKLSLTIRKTDRIVVHLPRDLRWQWPAAPITAEHRKEIARRIVTSSEKDWYDPCHEVWSLKPPIAIIDDSDRPEAGVVSSGEGRGSCKGEFDVSPIAKQGQMGRVTGRFEEPRKIVEIRVPEEWKPNPDSRYQQISRIARRVALWMGYLVLKLLVWAMSLGIITGYIWLHKE